MAVKKTHEIRYKEITSILKLIKPYYMEFYSDEIIMEGKSIKFIQFVENYNMYL